MKAIVNQSFLRWCKERERVEAEYEPRHFLPQLPSPWSLYLTCSDRSDLHFFRNDRQTEEGIGGGLGKGRDDNSTYCFRLEKGTGLNSRSTECLIFFGRRAWHHCKTEVIRLMCTGDVNIMVLPVATVQEFYVSRFALIIFTVVAYKKTGVLTKEICRRSCTSRRRCLRKVCTTHYDI